MAKATMKLPSYEEMPESPRQEGVGIALRLLPPEKGSTYTAGDPIVLMGKYGADARTLNETDHLPLTRMLIKVGKKEQTEDEATGRTVQDAHVAPPPRDSADDTGDYTEYGYFNVDLSKFLKVQEAGKYWVSATLLELKSRKLEFEVK